MFNKFKKNESGQSMVLVAIMITMLFGFGALAVDVGYMTYQKSELQNAADSAALAGALLAPTMDTTSVQSKIVDYVQINNNRITNSEVTKKIVNKTAKTVEVEIQQKGIKILRGFLSVNENTMTVKAIAKYNAWPGYALPFINIDDPYLIDDPAFVDDPTDDTDAPEQIYTTIELWEKSGSGQFERLIEQYIPDDNTFLVINDENNATIDTGKGNNIKTQLDAIVMPAIEANKPVYVLSFKDENIGEYSKSEMEAMLAKENGKIVANISNLVLLKGYITQYNYNANANDFVLKIAVTQAYEYDEIYDEIILDPDSKIISYLIK